MKNRNSSNEDIEQKKEIIYHDYELIRQMKCNMKRKIRLLSELFVEAPNPWQVTGITVEALKIFQANDFKKVSGMGINRSHIRDRNLTYQFMLEQVFYNISEWWDYFASNDKTVLSTVRENMTNNFSEIIEINSQTLFVNKGFGWRHTKEERAFLKALYERMFNTN